MLGIIQTVLFQNYVRNKWEGNVDVANILSLLKFRRLLYNNYLVALKVARFITRSQVWQEMKRVKMKSTRARVDVFV